MTQTHIHSGLAKICQVWVYEVEWKESQLKCFYQKQTLDEKEKLNLSPGLLWISPLIRVQNCSRAFLSPSRRDTPDYTESVPWPAARRRMPDQYPERAWSITNLIIINVGLSASVRSADSRATPWELQNGAPSEFGRAFLFPYFFGVFLHGFVCLFIATKSVVFCFFSRVNRW